MPSPFPSLRPARAHPLLAAAALTLVGSFQPGLRAADALLDTAAAHPSFNRADFEGDTTSLPIGVFDSGIGGLTVLEAILKTDAFNNDTLRPGPDGRPDFENERFIYFGDQANMPYGNYPSVGKTNFLRELIVRDASFLLGRRWHSAPGQPARTDKPPVKAIVIACNTATAYGLEDLRALAQRWKIPVFVVGVVEAGARGVAHARASEAPHGSVAVLATVGTCASGAYPRAISQELGRAGHGPVTILQRGSPALAGVIEGDSSFKQSAAETARTDIRALLDTAIAQKSTDPISTVTLGCTHFPLALDEIDGAFSYWRSWRDASGKQPFKALIAEKRTYVDPAAWTARELFRQLAQTRLRIKPGQKPAAPRDLFFLSVPNPAWPGAKLAPDGGLDRTYKYGRAENAWSREDTLNVPLTPERLPASSRLLVEGRLPAVWQRLREPAAAQTPGTSQPLR